MAFVISENKDAIRAYTLLDGFLVSVGDLLLYAHHIHRATHKRAASIRDGAPFPISLVKFYFYESAAGFASFGFHITLHVPTPRSRKDCANGVEHSVNSPLASAALTCLRFSPRWPRGPMIQPRRSA
jgi:hypothetical protein